MLIGPFIATMHQDIDDEVETEKSTRRLRELFHTKEIPVATAESLMRRYNNDYDLVAQDIIRLKEQDEGIDGNNPEVSDEDDEDHDIQDIAERLRNLPLTEENLNMFNLARRNEIPREQRQFACSVCDRDWWREVPERKQVSRCRRCKRSFMPVPRGQEWGFAEYQCPNCNHSFKGFGQMGLPAPCYRCRSIVLPIHIIPRLRDQRIPGIGNGIGVNRRDSHGCCAEDCYNRQEPHVPGTHCVHPQTRRARGLPKILLPCPHHESTGSTVASCISQGSIMECDIEEIILEDLTANPRRNRDE
ncbi:shiftless antiviral inhibitor of ribosomal frameshifting protein homolog [Pristis pectinata]|uniref:shiftless antiviral inhibitor of ribosomal frameshifting protein homolog n=1 Tax=Pristis pectinata TaxID=685728 RepID=UPI00223CBFD5|nr:shiftless antiviral inhibitor of ribosomal frameshifting protein homolog [Pristis pectinata]